MLLVSIYSANIKIDLVIRNDMETIGEFYLVSKQNNSRFYKAMKAGILTISVGRPR